MRDIHPSHSNALTVAIFPTACCLSCTTSRNFRSLNILEINVMHTAHLFWQLAFGLVSANSASEIGAVRASRSTTQNDTRLGVETLVACVDRPGWVSPHPPQRLQTRDCNLAIEDLWNQIPPWGGRSVEWFGSSGPHFSGYPTFGLPVFAYGSECLVTVDTLDEFITSPNWIPELPATGDVRPWPPPNSDIAVSADIEEGIVDVMKECVERTGFGGYARFGDWNQALGVFIWGKDSAIDTWAYGGIFEHRNGSNVVNDSVATA